MKSIKTIVTAAVLGSVLLAGSVLAQSTLTLKNYRVGEKLANTTLTLLKPVDGVPAGGQHCNNTNPTAYKSVCLGNDDYRVIGYGKGMPVIVQSKRQIVAAYGTASISS